MTIFNQIVFFRNSVLLVICNGSYKVNSKCTFLTSVDVPFDSLSSQQVTATMYLSYYNLHIILFDGVHTFDCSL